MNEIFISPKLDDPVEKAVIQSHMKLDTMLEDERRRAGRDGELWAKELREDREAREATWQVTDRELARRWLEEAINGQKEGK